MQLQSATQPLRTMCILYSLFVIFSKFKENADFQKGTVLNLAYYSPSNQVYIKFKQFFSSFVAMVTCCEVYFAF